MQVLLDDYLIDVVIIKKNNKNIYFRVKDDLKLYVTCNIFVSKREIERLIYQNKKSIIRMYETILNNKEYNNDFYYLGEKYNIKYIDDLKEVVIEDDIIYAKNKRMLDLFWKDECQRIFSARIEQISKLFDYLPKFSLKIRCMKTRWGVCNRSKNTVTLNSELLRKDVTLLDYVIVHELCHFKHPNHSSSFWLEVSKYYPYYKLARKKLREV